MISRLELNELERELKKAAPAMLAELAATEGFITLGIAREAMRRGALPKRPSPRLSAQEAGRYKAACLASLRCIRQELSGQADGGDSEPTDETEPNGAQTAIAPQEAIGGPQAADPPEEGVEAPPEAKKASSGLGRPYKGKARSPRSTTPPAGMKRVMINIPADLHRALKYWALDLNKTMTDVILESVRSTLGMKP